jgi:hypothetical protein
MFGQYEPLVCALVARMHLRDFREYVCAPYIPMKVLNKDYADVAQVSARMLIAYMRAGVQLHLQPQSDQLSLSTYGVMEADMCKYTAYRAAIHEALCTLWQRANEERPRIDIVVIGAGARGPLVTEVFRARHALMQVRARAALLAYT